jgi:hypothetical protein
MVTPARIPDNPSVTFDDFVLQTVRQLPTEDDWQRQICCAAFGLIAETTALMRLTDRWAIGARIPAHYLLIQRLGPLESYRALLCYHLHAHPGEAVRLPGTASYTLDAAVGSLVLRAGHLARAMQRWVSKGQWLDRRSVGHLRRFDVARLHVYGLLEVTPQQVWEACRVSVPPFELRTDGVPDALVAAVTQPLVTPSR